MSQVKKDTILVVDDERNLLTVIDELLRIEGYEVITRDDPRKALDIFKEDNSIDIVITDIRMKGLDGIKLLKLMKDIKPQVPVILITAYIDIGSAVKAMELGAYEYVLKPFKSTELILLIKQALTHKKLAEENARLKRDSMPGFEKLIGTSTKIMDIFKAIEKVSKNDSTVFITGESGTGKELIAKAIHYNSKRAHGQFVCVNCAAIPQNLLASELFGHEKGAFTGAEKRHEGLFITADKGTIFLDEVGSISSDVQVSLLRVIQEREVKLLGSSKPQKVDVRIICATNENLSKAIQEGRFREDLFYRLSVVPVAVPPLRERAEDIPILIHHFLIKYCFNVKDHFNYKHFTSEAIERMMEYSWPGNVRELENTIERLVTLGEHKTIGLEDLPLEIIGASADVRGSRLNGGMTLREHIESAEKSYILETLRKNEFDKRKTAGSLDIDLATLYRKLEKYGL